MEVSRTEILTNWLFCYFWKHHLSYSSVSSYNDIWMIIMRRTQCSMKNIKEWMIRNAFWITIYWKKKNHHIAQVFSSCSFSLSTKTMYYDFFISVLLPNWKEILVFLIPHWLNGPLRQRTFCSAEVDVRHDCIVFTDINV